MAGCSGTCQLNKRRLKYIVVKCVFCLLPCMQTSSQPAQSLHRDFTSECRGALGCCASWAWTCSHTLLMKPLAKHGGGHAAFADSASCVACGRSEQQTRINCMRITLAIPMPRPLQARCLIFHAVLDTAQAQLHECKAERAAHARFSGEARSCRACTMVCCQMATAAHPCSPCGWCRGHTTGTPPRLKRRCCICSCPLAKRSSASSCKAGAPLAHDPFASVAECCFVLQYSQLCNVIMSWGVLFVLTPCTALCNVSADQRGPSSASATSPACVVCSPMSPHDMATHDIWGNALAHKACQSPFGWLQIYARRH